MSSQDLTFDQAASSCSLTITPSVWFSHLSCACLSVRSHIPAKSISLDCVSVQSPVIIIINKHMFYICITQTDGKLIDGNSVLSLMSLLSSNFSLPPFSYLHPDYIIFHHEYHNIHLRRSPYIYLLCSPACLWRRIHKRTFDLVPSLFKTLGGQHE